MVFQSRVESDSQGFELINKRNSTQLPWKIPFHQTTQPPNHPFTLPPNHQLLFKLSLKKMEMEELWSRHSNDLNNRLDSEEQDDDHGESPTYHRSKTAKRLRFEGMSGV